MLITTFITIAVLVAFIPFVVGLISRYNYIKKFGKNINGMVPTPTGYLTRKEYREKYKDYHNAEVPNYIMWFILSISILFTAGAFLLAAFVRI